MYVPIILENHSIFSHWILYRCSWMLTTLFFLLHVPLDPILVYVLLFLENPSVFPLEIDVCSTNLMVIALKPFIQIIYFATLGYFWTNYFSLCFPFSWEPFNISSWYFVKMFLVLSDSHCTKKLFSHYFFFSARSNFGVF